MTLISFDAKMNSLKQVEVSWVTASEINNDYFNIQHSIDAHTFESIASVDGAGNSTVTLNYSYLDKNPLSGVSYYRLKQTDYDGTSAYSDVIAIQYQTASVAVFPNPVVDEVLVYSPWKQFTAEISDTQGRQMAWIKSEKNYTSIPVSGLTEGVYFISIQNGQEKIVKRLIKTAGKK